MSTLGAVNISGLFKEPNQLFVIKVLKHFSKNKKIKDVFRDKIKPLFISVSYYRKLCCTEEVEAAEYTYFSVNYR